MSPAASAATCSPWANRTHLPRVARTAWWRAAAADRPRSPAEEFARVSTILSCGASRRPARAGMAASVATAASQPAQLSAPVRSTITESSAPGCASNLKLARRTEAITPAACAAKAALYLLRFLDACANRSAVDAADAAVPCPPTPRCHRCSAARRLARSPSASHGDTSHGAPRSAALLPRVHTRVESSESNPSPICAG